MKKIFAIVIALIGSTTGTYYYADSYQVEETKISKDITSGLQIDVKPIAKNNIKCHALNLYHESRGESPKGQYAVFKVVENRKAQKNKSVCAVVYENKQFSWTHQNVKNPTEKDLAPFVSKVKKWRKAYKASATGIDHYHRYDINPSWNRKMTKVAKIDNHVFFKSR